MALRLHLLTRWQRHLELSGCAIGRIPRLDPSRLESFEITHDRDVDLSALAGVKLKHFAATYAFGLDLTPIANAPLEDIRVNTLDAKTWESVGKLRHVQSLKQVDFNSERLPAVEFWRRYDAGEFAGK